MSERDIDFAGQTVIVTGAGSGLGRTYAIEIARRGGHVVVNDLGSSVAGQGGSIASAEAVVDEIRQNGGAAIASGEDVASAQGARRLAEQAMDRFGGIDAVINNAGNMRHGPFPSLTLNDLTSLLAVHVGGAFNVTQAAWPHLIASGNGRVVFTSSGAGVFGQENLSAYGAAKGAVAGLMHVLSLEGARHGILCNAILPNAGTRMTSIFKPGDLGDNPWARKLFSTFAPEFTTALTLYLASRACQDSHGIYSAVGGRIARAFIGVAQGWQGPRDTPPTVEDIAAHWSTIRDDGRGYAIPASLPDESRILVEALGL